MSNLNPSYIKIEKYITCLDNKSNVTRDQMNLITGFKEIDFIKSSDFGDFICVVGEGANRLHLYSLYDYELKYCFWRGSQKSHTISVSFDLKCRFVSVVTEMKTLHIFMLGEDDKKENDVNLKMVDYANLHRFSKFEKKEKIQNSNNGNFGDHKQSLMKKIKV